jgi:ribosome maturation factor RimP
MPPAQAGPSPDVARRQLAGLLAPVVESAGYDMEDVTVTQAGRRSLVRVVVDADGGVDLDGVAQVSRAVSDALDEGNQFAGPYVLEVSSPGVERPLREPRQWRRAAGRLVTVSAGGTPLLGRVVATDDAGVTLDVDGTRRHLPWTGLGPGRVQVEFNRPDASAEQERG